VTIAIGIIAKKTIWMAADSQTTRGNVKMNDAKKISVLQLAGAQALIAEAGSAGVCQRIIEVMQGMAKSEPLKDYRTVADIAQKAMAFVRSELRQQFADFSLQEFNDFLRANEYDAQLMIAHFFNEEPQIYIANFILGFATRAADKNHAQYAAIGTGAQTAEYILSKLNIKEIDHTNDATNINVTTMYVVEEVKRVDTHCGGSMMTGIVHSANVAAVVPPNETMEKVIKIIKEEDRSFSVEWRLKVERMIAAVIKARQTGQL